MSKLEIYFLWNFECGNLGCVCWRIHLGKVHRYRDRWQHPMVVVSLIIRNIGAVCHRVYTYFVFASIVCPSGVLFFFVCSVSIRWSWQNWLWYGTYYGYYALLFGIRKITFSTGQVIHIGRIWWNQFDVVLIFMQCSFRDEIAIAYHARIYSLSASQPDKQMCRRGGRCCAVPLSVWEEERKWGTAWKALQLMTYLSWEVVMAQGIRLPPNSWAHHHLTR